MLASDSSGRAWSAWPLAMRSAALWNTPFGNVCGHSASPARVHLRVLRSERNNSALTLDTTAELSQHAHAARSLQVTHTPDGSVDPRGWRRSNKDARTKTRDTPAGWTSLYSSLVQRDPSKQQRQGTLNIGLGARVVAHATTVDAVKDEPALSVIHGLSSRISTTEPVSAALGGG